MNDPSTRHPYMEVLTVAFDGKHFTARVELPVVYVMVEDGKIVDVRTEKPEFLEAVLTAQELEAFLNDQPDDDRNAEFPDTFLF